MKIPVTHKREKSAEAKNEELIIDQGWQLAFFVLANILIFFLLFESFYKIQYSATGLYYNFAASALEGHVPYRDFNLEYPPLALVFFILPKLIASNYVEFANLYQFEVLLFNLVGIVVVYDIARRLGKAPWKLLTVYTLSILAIGPIIAQQYDIFPAIMMLLALYFFWLGKHKTSWALLALGTLTKIYPAVIAPIFLLYYIRNRQYRNMRSGILIFTTICLVMALPFLVVGTDSIWNLVSYHSQRGIQLESTYASLLLFADKIGLTTARLVFNFGSWNIAGSVANILARLSTYLLVISLLISYWFIYKQMKPGKSQFTRLGAYSLLVVSVTLVTSKVLSPQYLIWLIPLIPLIFNRWRYMVLAVFAGMGILTYYIFPHNYLALLNLDPRVITILILRNVLLIILAALAVISLQDMKPSE